MNKLLEAEKAEVKSVVDQFNRVWETRDLDLFSRIMAHDADMIVYGSDAPEHWIGWQALSTSVAEMFQALDEVKITVQEQHITVDASAHVGWFSQIWDWDFILEGKAITSNGQRLTGVLEKRNGSWVIVQIHNSVPVTG